MPLSKDHKARTRKRIVEEAAKAFRARGVSGTGIPELMGRAGLTHGGFYAHFNSKDALVAEACATGFGEAAEALIEQTVRDVPPGRELAAIIRAYLSRAHRDHPETGCMIPSLTAEMAHETPDVRTAFTRSLETYFGRLAAYMPTEALSETVPASATPDERAMLLLSGMMGAVQLARSVDDPVLSDRILQVAREFYTRAFALDQAQERLDAGAR